MHRERLHRSSKAMTSRVCSFTSLRLERINQSEPSAGLRKRTTRHERGAGKQPQEAVVDAHTFDSASSLLRDASEPTSLVRCDYLAAGRRCSVRFDWGVHRRKRERGWSGLWL